MCFAVGPGPIPWMITSEILPPAVRAGGVTICVFTNWLFTFIVGQVCLVQYRGFLSVNLKSLLSLITTFNFPARHSRSTPSCRRAWAPTHSCPSPSLAFAPPPSPCSSFPRPAASRWQRSRPCLATKQCRAACAGSLRRRACNQISLAVYPYLHEHPHSSCWFSTLLIFL